MTTYAPLSECCATASLHEGDATGQTKEIGDIKTYFAYPESKSTENAVLILSDVLGFDFKNTTLLADNFAKQGFLAVVPDLFYGDTVPLVRPEGFQIMDWVKNHTPVHVDPIIEAVIKHLRDDLGVKRIGGVGYCFGGKYVARHLKPGRIDVGYAAHPTMLLPEELEAIEGPLSISAAVRDFVFTPEKRAKAEKILDQKTVPWQINTFSHVEHGFAVRGDMSDRRVRHAKERAFAQSVGWFNTYLKSQES